jgi:hypothetical protein
LENLGEDGRITLKQILKNGYLNKSQLETRINGETSSAFHIYSGVAQGTILGPLFYVLYTSDLPTSRETPLGTFTDYTAVLATHADCTIASLNLQRHSNIIGKLLQKWKIKTNETKPSHITFALRKGRCPAVSINQTLIPETQAVKYREISCDWRLNWKEQIAR